MKIRLVALPPSAISRQTAIHAKRFGKKFPSRFIVDNKYLIPHITLFKVDIVKLELPNLLAAISKVAKKFDSIKLELYRYKADPEGWVVWDIKPSQELSKMRITLHKLLQAYHSGSVGLKTPYQPHITFTRYKNKKHVQEALANEKSDIVGFTVSKIAVTLYDKNSQVTKILKSYTI